LFELESKVLVYIKLAGLVNKYLGKLTVYSPIPIFICIGQSASGDFAPDAHMIKLLMHGAKATFNVTQAFSVSKLSEGHAHELIKA
jgi:hypothetical protein